MRFAPILATLAALLLVVPSWAQIQVAPSFKPHTPITAKLANPIPEGAQVQGGWSVTDGHAVPCGVQNVHVWAGPGQHTLAFRGVWLKTRELTIDGQTVQVLEGFGFVDESATFSVEGQPEPGPDPPDPTPGPVAWAIIVEETEERTPQLGALWQQVRDNYSLHRVLIIDQHNMGAARPIGQAALDAVDGRVPVLALLTDTDELIRAVPCPTTLEGIAKELGQ